MTNAVIVDAVRTPGGKRNGKLRNWHAADLASEPLTALVERNDIDPGQIAGRAVPGTMSPDLNRCGADRRGRVWEETP